MHLRRIGLQCSSGGEVSPVLQFRGRGLQCSLGGEGLQCSLGGEVSNAGHEERSLHCSSGGCLRCNLAGGLQPITVELQRV